MLVLIAVLLGTSDETLKALLKVNGKPHDTTHGTTQSTLQRTALNNTDFSAEGIDSVTGGVNNVIPLLTPFKKIAFQHYLGLYYKSFKIVIYDRNDYDRKLCYKLKHNLRS